MKNMKFIKSVLIVGSLVIATSAFADMPSTISSTGITTGEVLSHTGAPLPSTSSNGSLNAFAGVSTQTVSPVELKTVSGDGVWGTVKEIFRRAKNHKNNSCRFPNCK